MITKGFIVGEPKETTVDGNIVFEYKVRLPIIDGYQTTGACSDDALRYAGVCLPPHMHKTKFNDGDLVYVAVEDLNPDTLVIMGMQAASSEGLWNGSLQTDTTLSIERVSDFYTTSEGVTVLPYNIKVRAGQNNEEYNKQEEKGKYDDTQKTPYVVGREISYLRGTDAIIQDLFTAVNAAVTENYARMTEAEAHFKFASGHEDDTSILTINKDKWINSGKYPRVDYEYKFSWEGEIRKYVSEDFPDRQYDKKEFEEIGVNWNNTLTNYGLLSIWISSGPVVIEAGGTGATNAHDARTNLELFRDRLISSSDWEQIQTTGELEVDTIYYIY